MARSSTLALSRSEKRLLELRDRIATADLPETATLPNFMSLRLGLTGIFRELVKTRYGFHIVAVDQRIPGERLPFEVVREQIAARIWTFY
jgi:hypothetical protein